MNEMNDLSLQKKESIDAFVYDGNLPYSGDVLPGKELYEISRGTRHELNNALSIVLSRAELLGMVLDGDSAEALEKARENLRALINGIDDATKKVEAIALCLEDAAKTGCLKTRDYLDFRVIDVGSFNKKP